MDEKSPRWRAITESEFSWEKEALGFLRRGLPEGPPYQAWANFEFIAGDGSINEVDALVLAPRGLLLVEIKSRPGTITGDAGTWTWVSDNRSRTVDNPLLLANRKAKKLASLLKVANKVRGIRVPFIQAVVFLVERGEETGVLKVARKPGQNDRLRDEAEVMTKLRHHLIVGCREVVDVGDRVGILMDHAGDDTLAKWLRDEGPLYLEYLSRFGEDLLDVVRHLEEQGLPHRDIKPHNLGITSGPSKAKRHLVLFDFSLSRTPAEPILDGMARRGPRERVTSVNASLPGSTVRNRSFSSRRAQGPS